MTTRIITIKEIEKLFSDNISRTSKQIEEELQVPYWRISNALKKANKKLSDFQLTPRDFMANKRKQILLNMDRKIELEPWHHWFVGLVDGEGCFSITLKPSKYKPGVAVEHVFALRFHGREFNTLEQIRQKLNINPNVTKSLNNRLKIANDSSTVEPTVCLAIKSLPTLASTIIPIFNSFYLKTSKQVSFLLWKESIKIRLDKDKKEYDRLVSIYKEINPRLGNNEKKNKRITFNEGTQWYEFH